MIDPKQEFYEKLQKMEQREEASNHLLLEQRDKEGKSLFKKTASFTTPAKKGEVGRVGSPDS